MGGARDDYPLLLELLGLTNTTQEVPKVHSRTFDVFLGGLFTNTGSRVGLGLVCVQTHVWLKRSCGDYFIRDYYVYFLK